MTVPRVLVVDDSVLVRQVVADLIAASGEFTVAGMARDGEDAVAQVQALDPDIVTLDVAMPGMHGLEALSTIMREAPRPVVMLSALDDPRGGDLTIRALELGAIEFVHKPSRVDAFDPHALRDRLLSALRTARSVRLPRGPVAERAPVRKPVGAFPAGQAHTAIAVAASTGGPRALGELMASMRCGAGAAMFIVQHMPPGFTDSLARRLDQLSAWSVHQAVHGEPVYADVAYVAPGGKHMRVRAAEHGAGAVISIDEDGPVWGVRPAADLLFHSVAKVFGAAAVGVVLTGMGKDGADGSRAIRAAGGQVLVQDRATSTVWGMPSAAIEAAGLVESVPLGDMAGRLTASLVAGRRS